MNILYGKQVAVVVYGAGINIEEAAGRYRQRGLVVVKDSGFLRIHETLRTNA